MWQQKWVIGNWKMNGRNTHNETLLSALRTLPLSPSVLAGVAVPTVYLAQTVIQLAASAVRCGAQDVSRFSADGAYTGEVSAAMLADAGAHFALIGHSERRRYFAEDATALTDKIRCTQEAGLIPLLCVGETLAERQAGQAKAVVAAQLAVLPNQSRSEVAIAYEPVWAIGTGQVATVAQIGDMHAFIYNQILSLYGNDVKIRVLYGGSVNAQNAAEILTVPYVDGALVGGAALQTESFAAIIEAARQA